MSPVCSRCDGDIAVDNRAFAGYCSDHCKQRAHEARDNAAAAQTQKRAARRRRAAANPPVYYVR